MRGDSRIELHRIYLISQAWNAYKAMQTCLLISCPTQYYRPRECKRLHTAISSALSPTHIALYFWLLVTAMLPLLLWRSTVARMFITFHSTELRATHSYIILEVTPSMIKYTHGYQLMRLKPICPDPTRSDQRHCATVSILHLFFHDAFHYW